MRRQFFHSASNGANWPLGLHFTWHNLHFRCFTMMLIEGWHGYVMCIYCELIILFGKRAVKPHPPETPVSRNRSLTPVSWQVTLEFRSYCCRSLTWPWSCWGQSSIYATQYRNLIQVESLPNAYELMSISVRSKWILVNLTPQNDNTCSIILCRVRECLCSYIINWN